MKKLEYNKVEKFLSGLFHSWGSDTPQEAVWAANDFLKIIESAYDYKFKNNFSESYDETLPSNNYEVVVEELKKLIT